MSIKFDEVGENEMLHLAPFWYHNSKIIIDLSSLSSKSVKSSLP